MAHINPVHDYRLLGPNLSFRKIMIAERQHDRDIIYYPWSGNIPDSKQFNKLYQKQHPGEAAPDVGQNGTSIPASAASMIGSAMPFAGGILCLAGGAWMFRPLTTRQSQQDLHLAACEYQLGQYPQWEKWQQAAGLTTARQIELSLRWDGVTNSYSGLGYQIVSAHQTEPKGRKISQAH